MRASGLPPCPYAYPRNHALSVRGHEASVQHAGPGPSGPSSPGASAFTGTRTQGKRLKAARSCFADQPITCFLFPCWLGRCSLSQGDFLKFLRWQQFSLFQNHLGRQRSPSKSINKGKWEGPFLLGMMLTGLEERSLQTCASTVMFHLYQMHSSGQQWPTQNLKASSSLHCATGCTTTSC